MTTRLMAALGFTVSAALLATPAAWGADVRVVEVGTGGLVGQELRLNADGGEQNRHAVRPVPGGYRVTDQGGSPVRPGPGCSDTSPPSAVGEQVTCSGSNIIRSRFALGGLGDLLIAGQMDIQVRASGGPGPDDLRGGTRSDELLGGAGKDGLSGRAGRDRLVGGDGPDLAEGGIGDDRILGNQSADNLTGDAGDDQIFGGAGPDFLDGSGGRDKISGASGDDRIISSAAGSLFSHDGAADTINCGPGFDRLAADRKDSFSGCERVTFG